MPEIVQGLPPVAEIYTTYPGAVAARTQTGEVWVRGNTNQEWGSSAAWQIPEPMRIDDLTGVVSLSTDPYFGAYYAVKSDGSVWAAGSGQGGAFGDGTSSPVTITPVRIPLVDDAVKVVGTYQGAYAITSDGGMWAWGLGSFLEDRAGSTTTYPTPFQADLPDDIVDVVARGGIGYAIEGDGSLWAWGQNTHGRVGNGSTVAAVAPVQVQGLTGVAKIASDDNYTTYAVLDDGTLWAWGRNNSLGFDTEDPSGGDLTVPTQFPGATGVTAISLNQARWIVADRGAIPPEPEYPPGLGWGGEPVTDWEGWVQRVENRARPLANVRSAWGLIPSGGRCG